MKLTEFFPGKGALSLEEDSDGALRLKVPFLKADILTQNGRLYPKKVLEGAIVALQKKLDNGVTFGSSKHLAKMEADDVSHFVEGVEMKEGTAYATLRIIKTAKGRDVGAIIRAGGGLGVSARGTGSVKEGQVQDDFSLDGVDFTLAPASGNYADRSMICESASIEEPEETHELSEKALEKRYGDALRAGCRLSKEDFKATIEDPAGVDALTQVRERWNSAVKAGYKGSLENYIDYLEKESE